MKGEHDPILSLLGDRLLPAAATMIRAYNFAYRLHVRQQTRSYICIKKVRKFTGDFVVIAL